MGLFGPSGAEATRLEEEKKSRMEKIRQIKAQMQDDDGFVVETKTSFFGLIKTVTRIPKPTLEDRLTEATSLPLPPPPPPSSLIQRLSTPRLTSAPTGQEAKHGVQRTRR